MAQGPARPTTTQSTVDPVFPANRLRINDDGTHATDATAARELRMIRIGIQLLLAQFHVDVNLEDVI